MAYYKLAFGKKFQHGSNLKFRSGFKLFIEDGGQIIFGDDCFVNNYFSATARGNITVGSNCLFGENVKIYDHNHKYSMPDQLISQEGFTQSNVTIGNNCWIASNVTILKGVNIGDNCVIGSNCLIYKDVPNDAVIKHLENCEVKIKCH